MRKDFSASAKTYLGNMGRYVRRIVHGEATAREALTGIARDTKKLKHAARTRGDDEDQREAKKLIEHGRRAYNEKDYKAAESMFKRAHLADPNNALALTYLGHTAYKLGNAPEAVQFWKRAIATEPDSPAADKARSKLDHTDRLTRDTVEKLEQRLRE